MAELITIKKDIFEYQFNKSALNFIRSDFSKYYYLTFTVPTNNKRRINSIRSNIRSINILMIPLFILIDKNKYDEAYINKLLKNHNIDNIFIITFNDTENKYVDGAGKSRTATINFAGNFLGENISEDRIIIIGDDRRKICPVNIKNTKRRKHVTLIQILESFNTNTYHNLKTQKNNYLHNNEIVCPFPQRVNSNKTRTLFNKVNSRIDLCLQIFISRLSTWKYIVNKRLNYFGGEIFEDYAMVNTWYKNNIKFKVSNICKRVSNGCISIARKNRDLSPKSINQLKKDAIATELKIINGNIEFLIGNNTVVVSNKERPVQGFETHKIIFEKYIFPKKRKVYRDYPKNKLLCKH